MLLADRFLALNGRTIDLATGQSVVFRRLPAAKPAEHLAWTERCDTMSGAANGSGARLTDYGLLNDGGRFEALLTGTGGQSSDADSALPPLIMQAVDLFETSCLGEPRLVRVASPDGILPARCLDVLARRARLSGFVPISVDLIANAQRRPSALTPLIRDIVERRHLLLVTQTPVECTRRGWCARRVARIAACPIAVARVMLGSASRSARPNILLLVAARAGHRRVPACLPDAVSPGAKPACPSFSTTSGAVRPEVAAEAHERYQLTGGTEVVRLRARAVDAMREAASGRALRAEHSLRDLLGGLARRNDAAGAAWVALNLGGLLLDRGRALEAARMFDTARGQFDRANDLAGAGRAAICLGLAWTDEGRLTEAEAACRTARMAAQLTGMVDLGAEADLALARCLYWQGRFDEATMLCASLEDAAQTAENELHASTGVPANVQRLYPCGSRERTATVAREAQAVDAWNGEAWNAPLSRRASALFDSDRRVRVAALAARLSLTRNDLRGASAFGARAVEVAVRGRRVLDACIAHTALAAVCGALKDVDGLLTHVRDGLAAARLSHAPLRALRLRLVACDGLRLAGRPSDAARWLRRLATLDPARFPGLLRARLQIVIRGNGAGGAGPGSTAAPATATLVSASCPWRPSERAVDMAEEIAAVLGLCHDIDEEEAAIGRVCDAIRERTRAVAVGLVGRNGAAPALLARSGPSASRSTLVDRVLDTGVAIALIDTPLGLEAAAPVKYGGATIGAVTCRWSADALVDGRRAGCLLSAAAAATAPHVRSLLDRRESPAPASSGGESDLVGVSGAMQSLRKAAQRAAGAPFPVLIEGESGCGKELVARAIHGGSPRRARRFCALNCAALTDDLLEAELFGHARGAFTGAVTDRVGLFEEADGGTLFLDEVADLSARAQAKLLRALQDGEVRRIGENFARHVDARVIAATNRSLEAAVASGSFRHDLFYRLNVVHIQVPPLRERPDDIPVLAAHFWQRATARVGSRATLSPAAIVALSSYDWPGNVRELQNVMAAVAVSAPRRGSVCPACLPATVARAETGRATLDEARRVFERRFVQAALARAGGHRSRAAAALGISRQGLAKLMARLDIAATGSAE